MPKSCVAVGCTNHNMMQKTGLTFHIFPDRIKKKEKWEKWVHAMKRMNEDGSAWFPKSNYVYICSAHFISGRPSNDPCNKDFVPTIFQQKEIDSRKRKHAKIKLAAKTDHQTAQVDDFVSKTLQEPDRDNKMVKEKTVNVKDESDTKQADTKNSCLQQQEMMASGSSMDTSSHAKPGSLPIYPSSSVTVHVPYTGNHGQVSSPTIQHRQTAPGIKVGQTTAVIQKASPAPLPSRSVPLQTYQSKYGELLNVIEDLGREIKPTYAGSKMAQERLKKGIMHARTLVRECLLEVDKSSRQ